MALLHTQCLNMEITLLRTAVCFLVGCAHFVLSAEKLSCSQARSCGECLRSSTECAWCNLPNITVHCVQRNSEKAHLCGAYLEDKTSGFRSDEQKPLSNKILTSPQSAYVDIRVGDSVSFNVSIMTSRNYPVDFYFLMDLSASLRDDVEILKNTTSKLVSTLLNISTNYAVGFGTFVDKPVPPYVPNIPYKTSTQMCFNGQMQCADPYSYQHILTMTNDSQKLQHIVNTQLNISYSSDDPESGLDGAGQVLACKELIGWRNEAFHMLMMITDSRYHQAGDGKLGGVIVPYDGECHMDEIRPELYQYGKSSIYDYPSIQQLKVLFTNTAVTPIFAVTNISQNYYKDLVKKLGIGVVGELASNSNNLAQIIADKYLAAIGNVQFSIPEIDGLKITLNAVSGCKTKSPLGCVDVMLEQKVVFIVNVSLNKCTPDIMKRLQLKNRFDLALKIPALGQQLVIHLSPICQCECESEQDMNSLTCNTGGSLTCGLCSCNLEQRRFGKFCECKGNQQCPTGLSNLNCSGSDRGTCSENCFQCQCKEKYFGEACQCSKDLCPTFQGQICSNHGTCQCPQITCECNTAPRSKIKYSGATCNCDPDFCANPKTNTVCGQANITEGMNLCHCNKNDQFCICNCTCPQGTVAPFCEPEDEVKDRCEKQRPCAICVLQNGVSSCEKCNAEIISDVTLTRLQKSKCPSILFNGCYYEYYVDPYGNVSVSLTPEYCLSTSVSPWQVALGVLGIVIIIGIIVLALIKLIILLMDRAEYKKFKKHLSETQWAQNDNPLYVPPVQQFVNVTYARIRAT